MEQGAGWRRVPLGRRQQRPDLRRRRASRRRCRSAPPARSSSPESVSAAGTSTIPSAPGWRSWPIPPPGRPALPGRRLRPLAARRQAGVSRPPRHQVKIRGFRIEIGEIENALLRVPGVRDAAVVVAERAEHSKQLVAFYAGCRPLDDRPARGPAGESLPDYMVPSAFHWRDRLPLTANGKIDSKALTALAGTLDVAAENNDAPTTPTERRLAAAWAKVLGTPHDQIGRQDHLLRLRWLVAVGGEAGDHPRTSRLPDRRHQVPRARGTRGADRGRPAAPRYCRPPSAPDGPRLFALLFFRCVGDDGQLATTDSQTCQPTKSSLTEGAAPLPKGPTMGLRP